MIAKQYVVKALEDTIVVDEVEGRIVDGHFFYTDSDAPFGCYVQPGLYASVPGRLLTTAQDIADSCGVDFGGLRHA